MKRKPDVPEHLRELDDALSRIRFYPRASLGPEVIGRLRRGERLKGVGSPRISRSTLWTIAAALVLIVAGGFWVNRSSREVTVDQCCFDFDGGGRTDDGVLVVASHGEQVRRIAVYEDRDGSRSFTPGDVIRIDRGRHVAVNGVTAGGLVTARHCCSDLDGGGPPDDGLVLLSIPPDKVTLVALYESRPGPSQTRLTLR